MKNLQIEVHKFGGSSLSTVKQVKAVAEFVANTAKANDIIVVSANGDVTDLLKACVDGDDKSWHALHDYIIGLAKELDISDNLVLSIQSELEKIQLGINSASLDYENTVAFGEQWSAKILTELVNSAESNLGSGVDCHYLYAPDYLRLNEGDQLEEFDPKFSDAAFNNLYQRLPKSKFIATGFLASDVDGQLTTLGRNGSDYSATVFAALVDAKAVTIWTDVDGIYSADPNIIKDAVRLDDLSLTEAQVLSELGANVLHQKTIMPLKYKNIPANIKHSDFARPSGTVLVQNSSCKKPVKTITIKERLFEIKINNITEANARLVQDGLYHKQVATFATHYDKEADELTLFAVEDDVEKCASTIESLGFTPKVENNKLALLSLVGRELRQNREVIAKFLKRLVQFDVHYIHYPTNSHALCVLVDNQVARDLLKDLHSTFFQLEPSMPIVVLGYGNIGKQFIEILKNKKSTIEARVNKKLSLVAVANSRNYAFDENCLTKVDENVLASSLTNDKNQLLATLAPYKNKELVIIDMTASQEIAQEYLQFAENKWHIISANKIAPSDPSFSDKVRALIESNNRYWLTNTTAGAGLPVQAAIEKLVESGDEIEAVSGIFSGSLSWLFGEYDGSKEFSELLKVAKENAFTEPDPREDLSGQDVIRKIRILAQELGFNQARESFSSALPQEFFTGSIDDFWNKSEQWDEHIQELFKKSQAENKVIRYIATLTKETLSLELLAIDSKHAFANLNPCDNIFLIQSKWYQDNPLIIQGPGAGREVTAAGVINDLCDLLRKV